MRVDCDVNPFIPELWLFHSKKKCLRWCVGRFGSTPDIIDGADAQAIYVDGVAVVLFEADDEEVWENALLVHESYHIVYNHLRALGEERAGEEITAYMIQCVSGALMDAHAKWRSRHGVGND